MRFHDRREAGQELAVRLMERAADGDLVNPVVLALPRGGVPVAVPVAQALSAPLDVLVARKIGLPGQPETGIGAIVGDDPPLFDGQALEMLGLREDRLGPEVARERIELHRRALLYRGERNAPDVGGQAAIIIDDGLATGVTARAALRHLRHQDPARLILAVPVCAPQTADTMRSEADDIVCLHQPSDFRAVGQWYDNFDQVSDDEVVNTLQERSASTPRS
ncbi:phosphoribosyltransferase (plasmid) [Streptomyces sp. G6]|uniref:phosphoribosyltransferase n=1 Tax=Streptomyces sp. G6 TaxID=1178736 RepID=UPI003EDAECBA